MQLNVICQAPTIEDVIPMIDAYLDCHGIRTEVVQNSIFAAWRLFPPKDYKKFIPKLWSYRIVYHDDEFFFGTLKDVP